MIDVAATLELIGITKYKKCNVGPVFDCYGHPECEVTFSVTLENYYNVKIAIASEDLIVIDPQRLLDDAFKEYSTYPSAHALDALIKASEYHYENKGKLSNL